MNGCQSLRVRRPGWTGGRWLFIMLLLGLLIWSGAPARAAAPGEEDLDAKRGESPEVPRATTGPLITDTTIPQALGTATLFMPAYLAFAGGKFSRDWGRVSAGGDYTSFLGQMQFYYGVFPRTEVYVVAPYRHNWARDVNTAAPNGQRSANFGGLGNVSLTGKYLLLDEQPHFPAVAGVVTAAVPTGHHRHLNPGNLGTDQLGRGAYTLTPGLNFFKYAPPVLLYANLWYAMRTGATVDGNRKYYPDRVTVDLAMEYPIPNTRLVFLWELVSYYDAGRLIGHRANQSPQALVSTLPALEFMASHDWAFVGGILIDLFGKNTNYNFTPNFSVFYYF